MFIHVSAKGSTPTRSAALQKNAKANKEARNQSNQLFFSEKQKMFLKLLSKFMKNFIRKHPKATLFYSFHSFYLIYCLPDLLLTHYISMMDMFISLWTDLLYKNIHIIREDSSKTIPVSFLLSGSP